MYNVINIIKTAVYYIWGYWESQFLGRLIRNLGSLRRKKGSGALKEEKRTNHFFSSKSWANDYTTKQLILLKDMFFLKLCTNDYVTACILLQDMLLILKTLLTNPVMAQTLKLMPVMRETQVRSLGQEDPLEKKMAIHSSIPAWRIPWIEEPVRLQSTGSQRVGHDWATLLHFTSRAWVW